jgi:hypothetical protein
MDFDVASQVKQRMEQAIAHLVDEFTTLRTGRVNNARGVFRILNPHHLMHRLLHGIPRFTLTSHKLAGIKPTLSRGRFTP